MTIRKLVLAGAVALASLSLGACAAITPLLAGHSLSDAAPRTAQDARKALAVAHLAYQAVGVSLKEAAVSGALHGANAAIAKALFDKAGAFLDAADQADALADAEGVFAAVANAGQLIAQIKALIPN